VSATLSMLPHAAVDRVTRSLPCHSKQNRELRIRFFGGSTLVAFDDQSNMKIKTAGPATIPPGGKVKSVHEAKAEFRTDFEDGSSATLRLADPGSSVAVRDKNNALEYLG
jgi:hypothetical protein